jgi:hypothetical protein
VFRDNAAQVFRFDHETIDQPVEDVTLPLTSTLTASRD